MEIRQPDETKEESGSVADISIVIPVYRSESTLRQLHREIVSVMEAEKRNFEIIFVEDCGGDASWEVIQELVTLDERVTGIKLNRNYGQHNALLCGIRQARYEVTVTMDDDLQNPPNQIGRLLERLTEDADLVYGTPEKEQHGFFRNIASRATKIVLQKFMGAQTARNVSAFRAFRTRLRDAFANYNSPTVSIDVLLTWGTSHITSVIVEHHERDDGVSGYSLGMLINHAFNLMTGFSALPLRFASLLGFTFVLFGIGVMIWVLVVRFFGEAGSVPGFAFLASIITIFSGVQLFSLGIFGEYIARIHFRTMNQPPYVIQRKAGKTPQ